MAQTDKPISEFATGTLTENSVFPFAYTADNGQTYETKKISGSSLGLGIINTLQYSNLNTSNKTIVPAINELLLASSTSGISIIETLTAGSTSITLQNANIHTNSIIDFFTDTFGVNPTSATVSEGSITLGFEAQQSNVNVMIVLRGVVSS